MINSNSHLIAREEVLNAGARIAQLFERARERERYRERWVMPNVVERRISNAWTYGDAVAVPAGGEPAVVVLNQQALYRAELDHVKLKLIDATRLPQIVN